MFLNKKYWHLYSTFKILKFQFSNSKYKSVRCHYYARGNVIFIIIMAFEE